MNSKLINCLTCLGLTAEEINKIISKHAEILCADESVVVANIEMVISHGYPREEMGDLILVNPTFLCLSSKTLRGELESIEDVEESLKKDPYLI